MFIVYLVSFLLSGPSMVICCMENVQNIKKFLVSLKKFDVLYVFHKTNKY